MDPRSGSSGAAQDDGSKLAEGVPTLAERLAEAGYGTLAVVSHVYVSPTFGLDRSFEVFDESLTAGGTRNPRAGPVVDRVLEQLDRLPSDRPLFVFVHFFDPHWDYTPPPPFRARFVDPDYEGPVDGTLVGPLARGPPWRRPRSLETSAGGQKGSRRSRHPATRLRRFRARPNG